MLAEAKAYRAVLTQAFVWLNSATAAGAMAVLATAGLSVLRVSPPRPRYQQRGA